jgi:hypothetical protein
MAAAGTDDVEQWDRTTHNDSSGGLGVVVAILVAIVIAGRPARAEDGWNPPHVRPETAATQELVAVAITRSPTIRAMLERIEAQRRRRLHPEPAVHRQHARRSHRRTVHGRRPRYRHRARVRPQLGRADRHARPRAASRARIADHQSIVDSRTLAAFYEQFGVRTGGFGPGGTFETAGARQTGQQVRRESFNRAVRTTEEK